MVKRVRPKSKAHHKSTVSRERIEQARYAKARGLLSKQVKIKNGFLSYRVQRKIARLEELRAIPTFVLRPGAKKSEVLNPPTLRRIKVNISQAKTLRQQGIQVFNKHVLLPSENFARSRAIIRAGGVAGVTTMPRLPEPAQIERGPRRLSANTMQRIQFGRYGIRNFRDLFEALEKGLLGRMAKLPDEVWAFKLFEFHNRPGRWEDIRNADPEVDPELFELNFQTFRSDEVLLEYLQRYKSITDCVGDEGGERCEELFEAFELFRLVMGETLGPTPDSVYENWRRQKHKKIDRRSPTRKRKRKSRANPNLVKKSRMPYEEQLRRKREYAKKFRVQHLEKIREDEATRKQLERETYYLSIGKRLKPRKRKYEQ